MMMNLFIALAVVWIGLFTWFYTGLHRSQVKIQQEISQLQLELERVKLCEKD